MELSETMQEAIDYAIEHGGELVRYPGGWWAREGWPGYGASSLKSEAWFYGFGTRTVRALVSRGLAEYTDFRNGKRGDYPVRIKII